MTRQPLTIRRALVALAGVILLASSLTPATSAQQAMSPTERLAMLVNQTRQAQGLSTLAVNPELQAAAEAHAADMAANAYMEHESKKDGATPQLRANRAGYPAPLNSYWLVIEVISARATPEAAMNFFLAHGQHRGVVLRPTWREMGVAHAKGGPTGDLWVIEFGCRPNVLPVVAEPGAINTTLRLTNEECYPPGMADTMGKAVQMMISDKRDFDGASWEPFSTSKVVPSNMANAFVKLRDAKGKEVNATAQTTGEGLAIVAKRLTPTDQTPAVVVAKKPTPGVEVIQTMVAKAPTKSSESKAEAKSKSKSKSEAKGDAKTEPKAAEATESGDGGTESAERQDEPAVAAAPSGALFGPKPGLLGK